MASVHSVTASTAAELLAALADPAIPDVAVAGTIAAAGSLRLQPGQTLKGTAPDARIEFPAGADGICLTRDNTVVGLQLRTDPDRRAVFNDPASPHLGRLVLRDLDVFGCVRLIAEGAVRGGHVEMDGVDVVSADARHFPEWPSGYGVEVVPGALTVWNRQSDPSVVITADLRRLSAGRAGAPVRGSGIFVAGAGVTGGRLLVRLLQTGAVFSDGGIPPGTANRIAGGVFTVDGAFVDEVHNFGPVTTYGPNDMVLDNWGTVDRWTADAKITSFGPSAIGFVNFGTIGVLRVLAPIETFGGGARGFNVYAGTVHDAEFDRIVTRADGAVGLQISQPVGRIAVRRGIETFGGIGDSLVKGVVVQLPATPLSIKPGGSAREITIEGGLFSHGFGIDPLQLHGSIGALSVSGGFAAAAGGFEPI
ncbi:MAG: hypothetical protein ACRYF2_15385 [Janthinobacterium lividum]